jgi:lipopolysaccharide export LptBFGC system permease protein LptF
MGRRFSTWLLVVASVLLAASLLVRALRIDLLGILTG